MSSAPVRDYVNTTYNEMSKVEVAKNTIRFCCDSTIGLIYNPKKFILNWSNLFTVVGAAVR